MHSITCDALSGWKDRKTVHPRLCVVLLLPPQFPAKDYFRKQDRLFVKKGADLKIQNYYFILRC